MPEIPSVRRRTWREIGAFFLFLWRFVESLPKLVRIITGAFQGGADQLGKIVRDGHANST